MSTTYVSEIYVCDGTRAATWEALEGALKGIAGTVMFHVMPLKYPEQEDRNNTAARKSFGFMVRHVMGLSDRRYMRDNPREALAVSYMRALINVVGMHQSFIEIEVCEWDARRTQKFSRSGRDSMIVWPVSGPKIGRHG